MQGLHDYHIFVTIYLLHLSLRIQVLSLSPITSNSKREHPFSSSGYSHVTYNSHKLMTDNWRQPQTFGTKYITVLCTYFFLDTCLNKHSVTLLMTMSSLQGVIIPFNLLHLWPFHTNISFSMFHVTSIISKI